MAEAEKGMVIGQSISTTRTSQLESQHYEVRQDRYEESEVMLKHRHEDGKKVI